MLASYLSGLSNPTPFSAMMWFSLAISSLYATERRLNRVAFVAVLATLVVFCLGCLLAEHIRELYLYMLNTVNEDFPPEAKAKIGSEYFDALQNPAVGIGASYAASLAFFRFFFYNTIYSKFKLLLVEQYDNPKCEHCGQVRFNTMNKDLNDFVQTRKAAVERGLETPALSALLVEKFAEGMYAAGLDVIAQADKASLEIDEDHKQRRKARYTSIADLDLSKKRNLG